MKDDLPPIPLKFAYRRRSFSADYIQLPILSALNYLLFFVIGLFIFRIFSPVFPAAQCHLLNNFLLLAERDPAPLQQTFPFILHCLFPEILFFSLCFLFAFSYFCRTLQFFLLSYRAVTVGIAIAAGESLFRAGLIGTTVFTIFLALHILLSAMLLSLSCHAVRLSSFLRPLGFRQFGLILRAIVILFLHLLAMLCVAFISCFLIYLIL